MGSSDSHRISFSYRDGIMPAHGAHNGNHRGIIFGYWDFSTVSLISYIMFELLCLRFLMDRVEIILYTGTTR